MLTRIISAAAALCLLAVVVSLGSTAIGIAVFVMAVIAIREFYKALSNGGFKPVYPVGYLACLPLLFLAFGGPAAGLTGAGNDPANSADPLAIILTLLAAAAFILLIALFCLLVFSRRPVYSVRYCRYHPWHHIYRVPVFLCLH